MGNEQSVSASSSNGSGVSTSLSFLAGKRDSSLTNKRSGPVVVVKSGIDSLPTPADDQILKRFVEIPKFFPILRSALNQAGLRDPPDVTLKLSPRPILKFAYRLQDHLSQCAVTVVSEQDALTSVIRNVDYALSSIISKLNERKKRFDRLSGELASAREIQAQMMNVRFLLEDVVPCVETLNEILPLEQRLPPLNLDRVLERTPAISSTESSPDPGAVSRAVRFAGALATTAITSNLHIEPVEEFTVIDKPSSIPQRRS
ncbi:unnamed protein product [Anisakis simplex]|uniref:BLOC-1-related complex subunit 5 n=1 Tax=Anisakis simplex TaxID=6269 RepID=A0A0M3JZX1_ANISI|nr:unnamed protein product [Anisakis simplex]